MSDKRTHYEACGSWKDILPCDCTATADRDASGESLREAREMLVQAQNQTVRDGGRINDLDAQLAPQMVECGCGDIRWRGDMCHICGKCQMGCCMCNERIASLEAELTLTKGQLANSEADYRDASKIIAELEADVADTKDKIVHAPDCKVAAAERELKS